MAHCTIFSHTTADPRKQSHSSVCQSDSYIYFMNAAIKHKRYLTLSDVYDLDCVSAHIVVNCPNRQEFPIAPVFFHSSVIGLISFYRGFRGLQ